MKEIAATLTNNPIERPEGIDETYLYPLLHDGEAVQSVLGLLVAGWKGYLAESAKKTGKYAVNLLDRKDPDRSLFMPDEDYLADLGENIGSIENSARVQVRREGKGFTLSFPILAMHKEDYKNNTLSPTSLSNLAKTFPATGDTGSAMVSHSSPESYQHFYELLTKVIPKASQAQFFNPAEPIDIFIPVDVTKEHIGYTPKLEAQFVSAETLRAAEKYIKGYRLIGPPIPSRHQYLGELSVTHDDEETRYTPTSIKDVVNKGDYATWVAMNREVFVYADLHLPEDFAKFVGQSHNPSPSMIFVWFMAWMRYWVGDSANAHVEAVRPMSSIRDENLHRPNKPKVNKDGLMISPDGYIYYIPTVDNVDLYEQAFHEFVERDGGVFTLADMRSTVKPTKKLPANKLIYTDWENNKIAYSNSDGLVNILNLDGYQPVTSTQARNFLDLPIMKVQQRTRVKHLASVLTYTLRNRVPERQITDMSEETRRGLVALNVSSHQVGGAYVNGEVGPFMATLDKSVKVLGEMYAQAPNSVPALFRDYADTYGHELQDVKFHNLFDFAPIKWIGNALQGAFQAVSPSLVLAEHASEHDQEAIVNFIESRYPLSGMEELGTLIALVKYGTNYPKIVSYDLARRRQYLEPVIPGYDWQPKPLPYVAENRALMPHQARIDGILTLNKPDWTILDVDAGGGKTGIGLRYIITLLEGKDVKRACITCPSFLVKNYIEENVYFYDGRINMIVISTDTLNTYGEDGLRTMIENSPPNTILLTDFGFLSNHHRNRVVFYGSGEVTINLNAEFLTTLGIDYMIVDESHGLRNEESNKSQAARKLALTMDKKAIATGTFINNQISDTAGQFALFDPSVFGNKQDFIDEFAEVIVGGKVVKWKDNAEAEIRKRIGVQSCLISARRKEWGAMLPHLRESIIPIYQDELNPDWVAAYQAILEETIEAIKANKSLVKQLQDDNVDELDLAGALNPYLARLEMFMTAPGSDPLGAKVLKGDASIGPKVKVVAQIVDEHVTDPEAKDGKILIITNYHASADALYNNLPAHLKSKFIRYHAENKDRDISKFKRDPDIIGMIGVEDSLGTGHNFQFCSRIVRIETKWNPGDLEQANARIWRPDPKNIGSEARTVFIDWVVVDRTIDVCKFARLISKVISKVKFDEADNPKYDDLEALPIIKMNLDTIRSLNSITKHLAAYHQEYTTYKNIYNKEMKEFREKHKDTFKFKPIENSGEPLPGGAMMRHVTYVPEMHLPDTKQLGIVRYSDYVDSHAGENQGIVDFDTVGKYVHTEFGDGKIIGMSGSTLKVKLKDGTIIKSINKLKTFIIPDKKTYDADGDTIRDRMAHLIGVPMKKAKKKKEVPVEEAPKPVQKVKRLKTVEEPVEEKPKKAKKQEEEAPKLRTLKPKKAPPAPKVKKKPEVDAELEFFVEVAYDQVTLGTYKDEADEDEAAVGVLESLGFKDTGAYSFAIIKTRKHLVNFLEVLQSKFVVKPDFLERLEDLQAFFNKGPKNAFNARSALKAMDVRNFWRMKRNKAGANEVRPYAVVLNHELHIAFALSSNQPANRKVARQVRVPGVKWDSSDGDYIKFLPNKGAVTSTLSELSKAGITVANLKDVKKVLSELKLHTPAKKEEE